MAINVVMRHNLKKSITLSRRFFSVNPKLDPTTIEISNKKYITDSYTNVTPKILSYIGRDLHLQKHHPLSLVRQRIVDFFYKAYRNSKGNPLFSVHSNISPVVSVEQNFDSLLIPKDHPSRSRSDCYYINKNELLRAHATAHQSELIRSGLDNFLVVGEVYRRDEIDSTHYPVFHQIDAVRLQNKEQIFKGKDLEIFEPSHKYEPNKIINYKTHKDLIDSSKQPCHTLEAMKLKEHELKLTLENLAMSLFGKDVISRWVETYFPFTQPSWELEIFHNNQWMEVLGCGIVRNEILKHAGVENSIGYAFGVGLERLAMILYDIPDIRLFWSRDSGFLNQFNEEKINENIKYKPISTYPQCSNDLSFWLPEGQSIEHFPNNDFYDLARNVAGDIIEQVSLVDSFKHPKTGRSSMCFRLTYRHMEKTLTQSEVNDLHQKVAETATNTLGVTIR